MHILGPYPQISPEVRRDFPQLSREDAELFTKLLSCKDCAIAYFGGLPAHIRQDASALNGPAFTVLLDQHGHVIAIDPNQPAFRKRAGAG
jgi:hypothetical protein